MQRITLPCCVKDEYEEVVKGSGEWVGRSRMGEIEEGACLQFLPGTFKDRTQAMISFCFAKL